MNAPRLTDRPVTWVALAGFMGTGKSRIGWELSRALALHYVDTDKLISRVCGKSVPELFADEGEDYFRACERETVSRVCRLDHAVVSLGGGAFLCERNRAALLGRGPVVVLWASAETVYERTRHSERPLLQVPDPLARIRQLLEERRSTYEQGTIHIQSDGRPSEDIVEEAVARLWEWSSKDEPQNVAAPTSHRHSKLALSQPVMSHATVRRPAALSRSLSISLELRQSADSAPHTPLVAPAPTHAIEAKSVAFYVSQSAVSERVGAGRVGGRNRHGGGSGGAAYTQVLTCEGFGS